MKAYKIVKINNANERLSLFIKDPKMIIKYKLQEWVTPRKGFGPLCCFDSLESIKKFIDSLGNVKEFFDEIFDNHSKRWEVWECEIELSELKKVWRRHSEFYLEDLPKGTVLADRVKLLRRVL